MTRSDFIIKWGVYTLALVPVWILELYVLSRYPLFGVKPMLLPLAVVAVAVEILGVELRSFYLEGKHLSDLLAEPFLYYRVSISDAPALSLLPLATVTIIPNCGGLNKDDLHGS